MKEYSDPFSASKFGAAVVAVTVQEGFAPEKDTLADVFDEPVKKRKRKDEDDETMLERIQRQSSKKPMPPKKRRRWQGATRLQWKTFIIKRGRPREALLAMVHQEKRAIRK